MTLKVQSGFSCSRLFSQISTAITGCLRCGNKERKIRDLKQLLEKAMNDNGLSKMSDAQKRQLNTLAVQVAGEVTSLPDDVFPWMRRTEIRPIKDLVPLFTKMGVGAPPP